MKWATRAGIHIDRAACAWLIGRFIDPAAEFVFVTDPAQVPKDATPFDMRGAELGHHHGDCSFETILRVHRLTDDPALRRIAQIVHEADIDDERFHAPEAPGLDVVLRGLSMTGDDTRTMAVANPLFDGLHEYYRRADALGREPA
ncbi:chromate resistance protein ChrB domain-containing protein [Streptomyces virginiae]|uniref:chromate resistance protein ChrB domain-containing protein n=1 Tax=Streptomyces virginiae TaxID=1961 RepID=UPI0036E2D20F